MGILNVDTIKPVGGGTTITLSTSEINVGAGITFESNGQAIYAGIITATSFSGSGANLTSLPAANITGTLPAISGANLTNLNGSNIASGTVPVARIGTGTKSTSTFYRGDGTFATVTSTTINNNAANRIITGEGGTTLNGEANLTFDGSKLNVTGNVNVTGVGTFGGGVTVGYDPTLSPIQGDRNTWFYTRFDQSASVSGSTIVNLATGPIKISDTLPVANMTRQSFGGSTAMYHASTTTGGTTVSTDLSGGADPFIAKTYGLTIGCLAYIRTETGNGAGVIHYGSNGNDEHFYIRFKYNYNSGDHGFSIGKDNDGSDAWHNVMKGADVTGDTWYYIAARISQSGSIDFSLNGNPFYSVRIGQNTVRPANARFGLAGDPYNDNASKHRYATAFWYRGLLSDQQIRDEYEWAKTIWTGASLP